MLSTPLARSTPAGPMSGSLSERSDGLDVDHNKSASCWQAGVKHLVFSSLEDVRKYPGVTEKLPQIESAPGRYVGHWEAKAEVEVLSNLPPAPIGCDGMCPGTSEAALLVLRHNAGTSHPRAVCAQNHRQRC